MEQQNSRLLAENDKLKSKLSSTSADTSQQIVELQKELNETKITNEKLSCAIRELEQFNDDLERSKRALAASLDDFEARLNDQIERNVLLENELGEKGVLIGAVAELYLIHLVAVLFL